MLKTILELDGHTVLEAATGEAGFELIKSQCPDVASGDIGLPGIDGHHVERSVRSVPRALESHSFLRHRKAIGFRSNS